MNAVVPAAAICDMSRTLYERGWMPGTAGNISTRRVPTDDRFMITARGRDKGALTLDDIVAARVADGSADRPDDAADRPDVSAESSIHAAVYRATTACAVIHVHSPYATAVASDHHRDGRIARVDISRYELAKGLGVSAGSPAELPVFTNWADVGRIAAELFDLLSLRTEPGLPAMLIGYHGVTAWGDSLGQARNRLECVEAICALVMLRHGEG